MANDEFLSRIYLLQELNVSIYTIEAGLAILQKNAAKENKHFVFMLLLSTGLERLMKIVLSLYEYEKSGKFLPTNTLKKCFKHNLLSLQDRITKNCFQSQPLPYPSAMDDLQFLATSKLLVDVLKVLSDFAHRDRYIYLDGIEAPRDPKELPERRWDDIESLVLNDTQEIVACFEELTLVLGRILVDGGLLKNAQMDSPPLFIFMELAKKSPGPRLYEV